MTTETISTTVLDTPIGPLTVAATDDGLRAVLWPADDGHRQLPADTVDDAGHRVLADAVRQLEQYFAGERTDFDLPLDPVGTQFQRSAWDELRAIPYGETITYGEQARRMGDGRKARAVGAANGKNPLPIVVPCHRVIGSDGSLTGFAGGVEIKAWLLAHERATIGEALPLG